MKVVLISSNSKILLDQKIEDFIEKDTNIVKYNFLESSLENVLEEASYVSLFEEKKFLIVKNADIFGKEKISEKDAELLINYLENPYPCTSLIFTTYDSIDKRKAVTKKIIEKHTLVEISAPKNYELINEVKKMLSEYQIGEQSIKYLCESCLGNYDLIYNEIVKLSLCFKSGDAITLENIRKIVATNFNDNIFKFVDAVIQKDLPSTIQYYEDFMNLKVDSLQLINMLIREYRQMYYYKILEKKRYSISDMMSELKIQEWQLNKLMKNCTNYHKDDLKDYLLLLASMDLNIKSGREDKNLSLYNFLIQIMEF